MAKTNLIQPYLNYWTKKVMQTQLITETPKDFPGPFPTYFRADLLCGLACIVRLTGPNNKVSLNMKEQSAQGLMPPN